MVDATTWLVDNHGLFDYEAVKTIKSSVSCLGKGYLVRANNECAFSSDFDEAALVSVTPLNGEDWVVRHVDRTKKLWVVVNSLKDGQMSGHRLSEGDLLKFGRDCFRVKQVSSDGMAKPLLPEIGRGVVLSDLSSKSGISSATKGQQFCRVCLSDDSIDGNPMVSVCKCIGTLRFLHVVCLQEWMKTRLIMKKSEDSLFSLWRALECELCKQPLPSAVTVDGLSFNLLTVENPSLPFVILENFNHPSGSNKQIYLIQFLGQQPVMIGRGNQSQVNLSNDIFISRSHASLRIVKGGILLEDKGSKYGTLLQMKKAAILKPGSSYKFQIDRTVFHISLSAVWSFRKCCSMLFCCKSSKAASSFALDSDEAVYVSDDISLLAQEAFLNDPSPQAGNFSPGSTQLNFELTPRRFHFPLDEIDGNLPEIVRQYEAFRSDMTPNAE